MEPCYSISQCWEIAITTYHTFIAAVALLCLALTGYAAMSMRRLHDSERRLVAMNAMLITLLKRTPPR